MILYGVSINSTRSCLLEVYDGETLLTTMAIPSAGGTANFSPSPLEVANLKFRIVWHNEVGEYDVWASSGDIRGITRSSRIEDIEEVMPSGYPVEEIPFETEVVALLKEISGRLQELIDKTSGAY